MLHAKRGGGEVLQRRRERFRHRNATRDGMKYKQKKRDAEGRLEGQTTKVR